MVNLNDGVSVNEMLTVASPFIKALVDTCVKPKLVNFRDNLIGDSDKAFVPTEDDFQEYYHRTYKKLAVVNTLVFNNSQRFLKDIYLPLTLTSTNDKKIKEKVITYPHNISDEYGNILITDTAGMGKSTLMKRIFIDVIETNSGIPLIVELRRLSKDKSLISEIQEQLNSLNERFDSKLLLELIAEGGFIIILDGYDEISLSDRDVVTADIQDFISKASNNRFFITSRPEKALSSFGNFQEFKIEPLNKKEAFELLRKYDRQGHTSSLLISKLQEQDMSNIEEFLINPLLVSLLYTAFEYKQKIPFKKYLFYRQVYDANFESHDLTKGDSYTHDKYSKLEIDDFHRVLRHLGFSCFKLQKIEFTKDELLNLIAQSNKFCVGLNFKESDFLQDILRTVPLFAQDGNYYRWTHKSLQEYFAAQFIYLDSKEKQTAILRNISNQGIIEKFINVLDLYYDMDYKTFRNVIEYELLCEYETLVNNSYLKINQDVSEEAIVRRKELSFLCDSYIFVVDKGGDKDAFDGPELSTMVKDYTESHNLPDHASFSVMISSVCYKNTYGIHFMSPKAALLTLLVRKKNKLVKELKKMKFIKETDLIPNTFIKDQFEMIKVNDGSENEMNLVDNFDLINDLIEGSKLFKFVIDNQNAMESLKEIRDNIQSESEVDFLFG